MAAPPLGRRRHIVGRGAHDQRLPIGTQEVAVEHAPPIDLRTSVLVARSITSPWASSVARDKSVGATMSRGTSALSTASTRAGRVDAC